MGVKISLAQGGEHGLKLYENRVLRRIFGLWTSKGRSGVKLEKTA
jgi:hypothetical protein